MIWDVRKEPKSVAAGDPLTEAPRLATTPGPDPASVIIRRPPRKRPKAPRDRYLDGEEFRALLRGARDQRNARLADRDHFLLWLTGRMGVRVGELVRLRAGAFHFRPGGRSFARTPTLKKRPPPGAPLPERDVDIDDHDAERIRRFIVTLKPEDRLFPISERAAFNVFAKAARRAGLRPELSIHALRHYRGTAIVEATGDLVYARDQLGHSTTRMVEHYLHVSSARRRENLERLSFAEGGKKWKSC